MGTDGSDASSAQTDKPSSMPWWAQEMGMTEEEYCSGLHSSADGCGADMPHELARKVEVTQVCLLFCAALSTEKLSETPSQILNFGSFVCVYRHKDSPGSVFFPFLLQSVHTLETDLKELHFMCVCINIDVCLRWLTTLLVDGSSVGESYWSNHAYVDTIAGFGTYHTLSVDGSSDRMNEGRASLSACQVW